MIRMLSLLAAFVMCFAIQGNAIQPLAVVAGSGASVDLTTNLVGHWKMDEGSGSTTADSSGNGNTATLNTMDAADWVVGTVGPFALDGDGTSDYIHVPDPAGGELDFGTGDFSVHVCIKTTVSGTNEFVVNKNNGSGTNPGYIMRLTSTGTVLVSVRSTTEPSVTSTGTVNDGNWYGIGFTRSGTTATIYIDGSQDGSGTADGGSVSNARDLRFMGNDPNGAPTNWAPIILDDARVYDAVISADVLTALGNLCQ